MRMPTNWIINAQGWAVFTQALDGDSTNGEEFDSGFIKGMFGDESVIVFRTETPTGQGIFKNIAVVAGRLALAQSEDVSETEHHWHERGEERGQERFAKDDEQDKKQG